MPLYDFQCKACGTVFEVERPLGASGKVKCAKCGSVRTDKMFSAAGIVFKGSGFYVTDSKRNSASSPVKDEAQSPAADSATPEAAKTQDAKPAESKPADSKPAKAGKEKSPA